MEDSTLKNNHHWNHTFAMTEYTLQCTMFESVDFAFVMQGMHFCLGIATSISGCIRSHSGLTLLEFTVYCVDVVCKTSWSNEVQ